MSLAWMPPVGSMSKQSAARPALKFDFLNDLGSNSVSHFVENLKSAYISSKGKAGSKFKMLSTELTKALENSPAPGPCTFIAHCLEALVEFDPSYAQGLGHLVTRSLNVLDDTYKTCEEDILCSKRLAGKLFKQVISGKITYDDRVLVRLIVVFRIEITDIAEGEDQFKEVKELVEKFIYNLVKQRSYTSAVSLSKHFGLHGYATDDFLMAMVKDGQAELAGQFAEFLGKDSCKMLIQHCIDSRMYKVAYRLADRYHLLKEFPDVYLLYKRSKLRKLVGKGLWDIAELVSGSNRILQEYLVLLALERKQHNRAEALCEAFHLEDFDLSSVEYEEIEEEPVDYMQLEEILSMENILWIDNEQNTSVAMENLLQSDVVGIDCEWKPVRTKGVQPQISILQLATRDNVYVLDVPKLAMEATETLNQCIKKVFLSDQIIKLGYAIYNDLGLLSTSYPDLDGFTSCNVLLDLQNFPSKVLIGGLTGLAKQTMGKHLDKSMRMSDWSQRPLTKDQLLYAALDSAILIRVHEKLCSMNSIEDLGRSYTRSWNYVKRPRKRNSAEADAPDTLESIKPQGKTCFYQEHPSYKNDLQEFASGAGLSLPVYHTVTSGPDHMKMFTSTVTVGGKIFSGKPSTKKKNSEFSAACLALSSLSAGVGPEISV